jgi:short-subunit dehydrogenase
LVHNISRNPPEVSHPNLTHYSLDVLKDPLPQIENIDTLIYCPGSINLKPIGSLSIEDFRNDFEINVIGAVKTIQKYTSYKKKELILRLYCLAVAVKLECLFMPVLLQQKQE